MSNQLDRLRQLERVALSVRAVEAGVKRLASVRNELTRELRREGVSVIKLAETMHVTRPRAYQILDERDPEEDARRIADWDALNEAAAREFVESDETLYREWLAGVLDLGIGALPSAR